MNINELPEDKQGTKVITEVLEATSDSLFPLQGALGYELHQTLFVGPNCLIVEGPSDLLYLQAMSSILENRGRIGLCTDWTITPVGGSANVPAFVALIGAQSNLNVAVLVDYQKSDRQLLENLYRRKLLKKQKVLTYADFTNRSEADIEDMFSVGVYLKLVNDEFRCEIDPEELPKKDLRIVRRIEEYIERNPLPNHARFNHYRPARYFSVNSDSLAEHLSDEELDRFERAFRTLNALLQNCLK